MDGLLIYDGIFEWEGWGGKLRLGSGQCRLRVYDLKKDHTQYLMYLKPMIVIVSDIPESKMSVRSCAGHIATSVSGKFGIDPNRMLYIEHYPTSVYGSKNQHRIPERLDIVDFTWREGSAIYPKWRTIVPPIKNSIMELIQQGDNK